MYWVFGLDPETLPEDYVTDPAVMINFQERTYYDQVKEIDDDFVPYLMPWYGTIVTASALGCQIEYFPKQDPAANPRFYPIQTAADVRRMQIADPERDGLMPRVLDYLRLMKQHSFLPVGITDFQGPLTTANQLMGYDKLIYLMHDDPRAMHELMDKVTETLIVWVKKQKEVIGEPLTECIGDQQVYTGEHAGVWFSDDDAVLMSTKDLPRVCGALQLPHPEGVRRRLRPLLRQRDASRRHFPRHGGPEGAQYLQPVQYPLGRRAAEEAPGSHRAVRLRLHTGGL